MKIQRRRGGTDTGPKLFVETPSGEVLPAKHTVLGAVLTWVARLAEHHYEASTWVIVEEDGTRRASVKRTADGVVEARVVGIHAHA